MMMMMTIKTIKTTMKIVMMKTIRTTTMKMTMMINIRVVMATMVIMKNASIGHMVTMAQKINIIGITNMATGGIKALDGTVKKKSPSSVMSRLQLVLQPEQGKSLQLSTIPGPLLFDKSKKLLLQSRNILSQQRYVRQIR